MSDFRESIYNSPEDRPFAAFYGDLSGEESCRRYDFLEQLTSVINSTNDETLEKFATLLYNAVSIGFITHSDYNPSNRYGYKHCYSNRVAAWWNADKKVMEYLSYDRVRGVKVSQLRLVLFLRKLLLTYRTYAPGDEPLVPEDVAPYVTQLFPSVDTYKVEIVDDAALLYDQNTMGHIDSCMVGRDYVKFYTTAPVKGLIIRNKSGQAVGRTLLWTLDDGRQVHDRLYRVDEFAATALRKWAKDNNVLSKVPDVATVTAPKCKYGYPYMDTFTHGVVVGNNIVLFDNYMDANNYLTKHIDENDFYNRIFDMAITGGGDYNINAEIVLHNGRWVRKDSFVEFNGNIVCIDELPSMYDYAPQNDPNQLYVTGDTEQPIVYGHQLYCYDGCVYLKADTDFVDASGRIPRADTYLYVDVVGNELTVTPVGRQYRLPEGYSCSLYTLMLSFCNRFQESYNELCNRYYFLYDYEPFRNIRHKRIMFNPDYETAFFRWLDAAMRKGLVNESVHT